MFCGSCLTIDGTGGQKGGVAVAEPTGTLLQGTGRRLWSLALQRDHNICTVNVLQSSVQVFH